MLERSDRLGGAIQTAENTMPGFQHDEFSAWHSLSVHHDQPPLHLAALVI